jgi:hypothetical protein
MAAARRLRGGWGIRLGSVKEVGRWMKEEVKRVVARGLGNGIYKEAGEASGRASLQVGKGEEAGEASGG